MLLRSTNRSIDRSRWSRGTDLPEITRRSAPNELPAAAPLSPILPPITEIEPAVHVAIKAEFSNKISPYCLCCVLSQKQVSAVSGLCSMRVVEHDQGATVL